MIEATRPFWTTPCPSCGGPAVFRLVGENVVGACADLHVPCYWSDCYSPGEAGWIGTTGELAMMEPHQN